MAGPPQFAFLAFPRRYPSRLSRKNKKSRRYLITNQSTALLSSVTHSRINCTSAYYNIVSSPVYLLLRSPHSVPNFRPNNEPLVSRYPSRTIVCTRVHQRRKSFTRIPQLQIKQRSFMLTTLHGPTNHRPWHGFFKQACSSVGFSAFLHLPSSTTRFSAPSNDTHIVVRVCLPQPHSSEH